jgi:DNA-binding response OmpR family regulator
MMKLLVIEDDDLLGRALCQGLREAHYVLDWAKDGSEGWHLLRTGHYDGAILDWMLPGVSGTEILARHRSAGGATPILMLTAKDAAHDMVRALDGGADDYLVKPFDFGVLLARLRALVRRAHAKPDPVIRVADLEIDLARREVRRGGADIPLTPREFGLLELLALHANEVVTRSQIWDRLYETDAEVASNGVDVYISYLRRKIDRGRTPLIVTRRGHGYLLRADPCDSRSGADSSSPPPR